MLTKNIDWPLVITWVLLVCVGLVAIYSTTNGPAVLHLKDSVRQNFSRQIMWAGICTFLTIVALFLPTRFYQRIAYPAYGISLVLCIAAILIGREINGAKSWISIGGFSLQSAELAKAGTLLAVARFLSGPNINPEKLLHAAGVAALLLLPAVIILLQNDTGTALVFVGLIPIMLFWAGMRLEIIALLLSPAVAGYIALYNQWFAMLFALAFIVAMLFWTRDKWMTALGAAFALGPVIVVAFALPAVLQPHQMARINSFTNPEAFSQTVGYHVVQSKMAIGSGGVTGKGFMEGTQTQLAYIPEQSTDFIFSVVGEEWGFLGSLVVLILFAMLIIRLVALGVAIRHPFGRLFAAGAAGVFFIHVLINLGMTMGVVPVIGIPLPFVSYGGSALLANTVLMAVVLTLYMRRNRVSSLYY